MSLLLNIVLSSLAVYFTAWLLPGIEVKSLGTAIVVAIVLGVLNAVLKPLLEFLSFPITVVTMGLFLTVINTIIVMIAGALISNFHVQNFWWALLFSVIVGFVTSLLEAIIG